jgi:hypothetical protein
MALRKGDPLNALGVGPKWLTFEVKAPPNKHVDLRATIEYVYIS